MQTLLTSIILILEVSHENYCKLDKISKNFHFDMTCHFRVPRNCMYRFNIYYKIKVPSVYHTIVVKTSRITKAKNCQEDVEKKKNP